MIAHSPLRYPGGKSRAVKQILEFIPPNIKTICSPFFGGGSIELALASKGINVKGFDVFAPLVNFWQVLLRSPKELSKNVRQLYPMTSSKFYLTQREYKSIRGRIKQAAAFYALNRASFSGTTLSGGMSPDHPRFTEKGIDSLSCFKVDNLTVDNSDFKDALRENENEFLYLDPPYMNGKALYGEKGNAHKHFDHRALFDVLKKRDGWILSYNDCEKVRRLYDGHRMLTLKWGYGMNNTKRSNELLIFK